MRDRRPRILLGWNRQLGSKDRIGQVVRDPIAVQERQEAVLQVPGPPSELEGVHGQHDRAVAGGLGPLHERAAYLPIAGPVELEPARHLARRGGHGLHGVGGNRAQDERHAGRPGSGGNAELAIGVDDANCADGGHEHRSRQARSEQLGLQAAACDTAQVARDQLPPVQRGAVGSDRRLRASSAGDVAERLGAEELAGALLQA